MPVRLKLQEMQILSEETVRMHPGKTRMEEPEAQRLKEILLLPFLSEAVRNPEVQQLSEEMVEPEKEPETEEPEEPESKKVR